MPLTMLRVMAVATVAGAPGLVTSTNLWAAEPPASIRRFRSETVVEADGTAKQTTHIEIAVSNDAAARREAQQFLPYTDGIETVRLVEGYTVKPDGRRLPVPAGGVRIQLAPGTPNLPQYTNRKQIVAVMPDVAGGDVLAVTWQRIITKPTFPGQFALTSLFSRNVPWDDAELSISVPENLTLTTETHGPEHTETSENGRRVHRWHWSAPALASAERLELQVFQIVTKLSPKSGRCRANLTVAFKNPIYRPVSWRFPSNT